MISLLSITFFIPSLIIGAIGSLYLKKASKKLKLTFSSIIRNYDLLFGIFLSVVGVLFYMFSLKYANLSKIYSLASLNYIVIAVLSAVFLKEKITLAKATGIIFITIGCFFVIK